MESWKEKMKSDQKKDERQEKDCWDINIGGSRRKERDGKVKNGRRKTFISGLW